MSLQKQNITIDFSGGLDTKTDPKQVIAGKLLRLANSLLTKTKQLIKRNGFGVFTKTTDVGTLATGKAIYSYNNEILVQDKTSLYSYSANKNKWITKSNKILNFDYTANNIIFDQISKSYQDTAYDPVTGYQIFVFSDNITTFGSNSCYYMIIEKTSGNVIVDKTSLGIFGGCKVLLYNNNFVIININGSGTGVLSFGYIPCSTLASPGVLTSITTGVKAGDLLDCAVIGSNIYVCVVKTTANNLETYKINNVFTTTLVNTFASDPNCTSICVAGYVESAIFIMYGTSFGSASSAVTKIYNDGAGTSTGPFTLQTGKSVFNLTAYVNSSSTATYIFYNSITDLGVNCGVVYSNGSTNPAVSILLGNRIASKMFLFDSKMYFISCPIETQYQNASGIYVTLNDQQSYYLNCVNQDISFFISSYCAGKFEQGYASIPSSNFSQIFLPEVNTYTVNSVPYITFSYLQKSSAYSGLGGIGFKTGIKSIDIYYDVVAPEKKKLANNLLFGGANLNIYDGDNVVESGFNTYPVIVDLPNQYYGGGAIGVGVNTGGNDKNRWQYCAVYEWVDTQGQKHRSGFSIPSILDMNHGANIDITALGVFTCNSGFTYMVSQNPYDTVIKLLALNAPFQCGGANFPLGSKVTKIIKVETTPGVYVAWCYVNNTCTVTGTTGITYTAAVGITFASITTVSGSKSFTAAAGSYKVGQRLLSSPAASGPFPDGTIVTKDLGSGNYEADTAATTGTTYANSYTNDIYQMKVDVRNLTLTNKNNVSIALYRTTKNGSIFYRVSDITNLVYSQKSAFSTTITDAVSDYELVSREQLYSTGGEVENIAPPAPKLLTTYKNRIVLVPKDNQNLFWYSKQVIAGFPVEFSDSFTNNINGLGGPITAIAVLDEKLIIFKANHIFYMLGEGPSSNGLNNDFSSAQLISSDVGCINRKSLANIAEGLLFQSSKGIYLLNRAMQIDDKIGSAVEQYSASSVISTQIILPQNQVRFHLSSGITLIYDTFHKQWGTFSGQGDALAQVDSVVINDIYYFINPDGVVKQETPGVYLDYQTIGGVQTSSYISQGLDTAWFSFAGIEAYQRIYKMILLGNYVSNHTMTIKVYYDFDESTFDTVPIGDAIIAGAPDVFKYRIFMPRQKCTSMRFSIDEVQVPTYFGEGLKLSSMSFEVGLKKGLDKIKSGNSYG